jgi:hypothetical protein
MKVTILGKTYDMAYTVWGMQEFKRRLGSTSPYENIAKDASGAEWAARTAIAIEVLINDAITRDNWQRQNGLKAGKEQKLLTEGYIEHMVPVKEITAAAPSVTATLLNDTHVEEQETETDEPVDLVLQEIDQKNG